MDIDNDNNINIDINDDTDSDSDYDVDTYNYNRILMHKTSHINKDDDTPFSRQFDYTRMPKQNSPNLDMLDGGRKKDYFEYGAPLYEASIRGDWKAAKAILIKNTELVRYAITENGETALHVAVSANRSKQVVEFVKNLVQEMTYDDLGLVNKNQNTALYLAAAAGNVEMVKILAEKNDALLKIPGHHGTMMPLYAAATFGMNEVVEYLYYFNSQRGSGGEYSWRRKPGSRHFKSPRALGGEGWTDETRGWLLEKCVESDMFDIALHIVKTYPHLGRRSRVLGVLARKPKAFSETESSFIKRTIYSVSASIGLNVGTSEKENKAMVLLRILWEDIVKLPKKHIDDILRGPPDETGSGPGRLVQTIQLNKLISKHLDKLQEESLKITNDSEQVSKLKNLISEHVVNMHVETQTLVEQGSKIASGEGDEAQEIQNYISEHIMKLHDDSQNLIKEEAGKEDLAQKVQKLISSYIHVMHAKSYTRKKYSSGVLFVAAEMGNTNFLIELIRRYPDLIWKVNDNNQTIFHIAIKHRHAGIYNLLYEIGAMKDMITPMRDRQDNNMLHLVGKLTVNRRQSEDVLGEALDMQRELLWYQEVESIIPPSYRDRKNSDGLTPHQLFTEEHKDMVTQGKKWIKEIASQCMVVAALVATMVFAAAFTVPGGYDQNSGIPIFHPKTSFKIFVVADAISLFSSSASILYMFLSVFTSRYAEVDFLESLPRKLIVGMSYLFLSMTSMMVAFSVSFFILYQKEFLWIPILISGFALIPCTIYVKAQHILFVDIIRSTYRSKNVFRSKQNVLYYKNPSV